ncbi:MAG: TIGR01212 family radical SAM protein [Verrucomicrobiota bacterium]
MPNSNNTLPNTYLCFPRWMREHYGTILHRVPLDLGFGCPNRSENGADGCIFCAENGGRARQITSAETLEEQIEQGVRFARKRYRATEFMAYVQAFTGTFAPESEQRWRLFRILDKFPFRAISIGTRPDCLPDATIDNLRELRNQLDVWIELGVQTLHDDTLRTIRRGHTSLQSRDALQRLHDAGLRAAVHLITGLPGETRDHVRATAEALAELPFDGIKIHNLHILAGTELARQHSRTPLSIPDEYEHAEMVIDILRRISPRVAVMRIQTDSAPDQLVAPQWTMSKGQFREFVDEQMHLREYRQGDLNKLPSPLKPPPTEFAETVTGDGTVSFWNPAFHEHYHAPVGAGTEALAKYVIPSELAERLEHDDVHLLDICFGLGYNTLAACQTALDQSDHTLHVTALEADRRVVRAAAKKCSAPQSYPPQSTNNLETPPLPFHWGECLDELWRYGQTTHANVAIRMLWGDARYTLRLAGEQLRPYDIVFLDPFSTQRNSELWTVDFFRRILAILAPDGVLLTYSTAKPVLAGLRHAGFSVGLTPPRQNHRAACIASPNPQKIPRRLPDELSRALQNTTGGIPYRDPAQTATNREILRVRQQRVLEWKNNSQ